MLNIPRYKFYCLNERIWFSENNYLPINDDIIRVRRETTGVLGKEHFTIKVFFCWIPDRFADTSFFVGPDNFCSTFCLYKCSKRTILIQLFPLFQKRLEFKSLNIRRKKSDPVNFWSGSCFCFKFFFKVGSVRVVIIYNAI